MELFFYAVFGGLGAVVAVTELSKSNKDRINTSSAFNSFKNNYLIVYSLMMGTDLSSLSQIHSDLTSFPSLFHPLLHFSFSFFYRQILVLVVNCFALLAYKLTPPQLHSSFIHFIFPFTPSFFAFILFSQVFFLLPLFFPLFSVLFFFSLCSFVISYYHSVHFSFPYYFATLASALQH